MACQVLAEPVRALHKIDPPRPFYLIFSINDNSPEKTLATRLKVPARPFPGRCYRFKQGLEKKKGGEGGKAAEPGWRVHGPEWTGSLHHRARHRPDQAAFHLQQAAKQAFTAAALHQAFDKELQIAIRRRRHRPLVGTLGNLPEGP